MLIIWGLILAGLIVIIAAYQFICLWLTWMDNEVLEEPQEFQIGVRLDKTDTYLKYAEHTIGNVSILLP